MRSTRNLWLSVGFVAILVIGSIAAFAAGTKPVLGLDLEGGVSVILQAPAGTPKDVMDRALENIRNRVDAFGVSEPLLFVSGNTIEVQLPGLARGTIELRAKDQYCLLGAAGASYGCYPTRSAAQESLDAVDVAPAVQEVCLTGLGPDANVCYGTEKQAKAAIGAIKVVPASKASPAPSPSPSPGSGQYCLNGTGLASPPCDYDTKEEATAALAAIGMQPTIQYCLQGAGGRTLQDAAGEAACVDTFPAAQEMLGGIRNTSKTGQYCVFSSAGKGLGCFLTREEAQARLQQTGQQRLIQVIGTTARLEQRQVLEILTPGTTGYKAAVAQCTTEDERQTAACSFGALKDEIVVFIASDGKTKYRLGPVRVTGDMINKAAAVYDTGSQTSVGTGWQIDFTLTSAGSEAFGAVTSELSTQTEPLNQLAIVVDAKVISAPVVQEEITGQGVITGSFTQARAKDLATQLNAGALPVNLKTQQVLTVSPTLGSASLREGLIAGIVGLVILALYLLFYYRLLGVVAFMGMSVWALLALALVSLAGRAFGYALTLAGVAGLVISLGVAADSYIVFFERLKDEVRHGKTPRSAVQPAFKRAYKTIVAADIVTALAAIILYVTAVSSVRGFALTLGVATALDLFVVYFFKRPIVFLIARSDRLVNLHGFGLTSGVAGEPLPGEPVPAAGGSK
ncbi:MAG: protein translocase subunit SecD [Actinomycetota bacterium]